jgi:hypothetical protein
VGLLLSGVCWRFSAGEWDAEDLIQDVVDLAWEGPNLMQHEPSELTGTVDAGAAIRMGMGAADLVLIDFLFPQIRDVAGTITQPGSRIAFVALQPSRQPLKVHRPMMRMTPPESST